MRAQHDDAFYAARADYILKNNGSTDTLIKKLSAILKELRAQDGENQAQK
jgi:dephospho-CoA kinase